MSNARSPREVCSTTIGTSGLMVLASFACAPGFLPNVAIAGCRAALGSGREPASASRASRAARPPPSGSSLPGRPQLLARLRLLDADRLRALDDQLERHAAWPTSSRSLSSRPFFAGARAASRRSCRLAPRPARAPRAARSSVGSICSASTIAAEHRLAPQRRGRLGLGLVRQRLLVLAGDPQVGLLRDPLARQRAERLLEHLVRARVDELVRAARPSASATAASTTASLNSRSIARSSASRSRLAMSSRSSASVSNSAASEANSSSSSGSRLALTSLTVTSKVASLAAELARIVLGERDLDGALARRRWRRRAAPRSRGSGGPSRARAAGRGPRRPRTARRRRLPT